MNSIDNKPYFFSYFNLSNFTLSYKCKPFPIEGLAIDKGQEKPSALAYNSLFEGSAILQSNAVLPVTHSLFIEGNFNAAVRSHSKAPPPKVTILSRTRAI